MDLHAGQIQGFFSVPVDHMTALPLFAQYYRDKGFHGENIVAVSPDPGRAKMARRFGQMLDANLAIMNKTRPEHDTAEVTEVIGRRPGQDRHPQRRHDRDRRDADRRRHCACSTPARPRSTHARRTGCSRAPRSRRSRPATIKTVTVTDTVPIDPVNRPGQRRRPAGVAPAGGDDHERLRRRVGLGDLRGREPALLRKGALCRPGFGSSSSLSC